jgi:predicted transposase YbfD/YdcC
MVSAFASGNGVVLGQIKTAEKSNEITAIPALLKLLDIKGSIVTIDAMGCQKKITQKIIDGGADYVIAVKGNQQTLHEDIKYFFNESEKQNYKSVDFDYYDETDKAHGRLETRRYWICSHLECLAKPEEWAGLQSIGMAENETLRNGKITIERRYFITSLLVDAKIFGNAVRSHWSIENSLHWVLDMSFREDESRIRKNNGAENFAVVRHLALNLLKQEKTHKRGMKGKRYKAALDIDYAEKVLLPILL